MFPANDKAAPEPRVGVKRPPVGAVRALPGVAGLEMVRWSARRPSDYSGVFTSRIPCGPFIKVIKIVFVFAFLSLFPTVLMAEIVTTEDGRKLELRADGTYRLITNAKNEPIDLTEWQPFFEHHAGEYNQNSMRFMPVVRNDTDRTVLGFRFQTTFSSAFGDEVFSFSGESNERVQPSAFSTWSTFYFFEDNPFINDEPYDKLRIFETTGTGNISTKITAVVFEDGEIVLLE